MSPKMYVLHSDEGGAYKAVPYLPHAPYSFYVADYKVQSLVEAFEKLIYEVNNTVVFKNGGVVYNALVEASNAIATYKKETLS